MRQKQDSDIKAYCKDFYKQIKQEREMMKSKQGKPQSQTKEQQCKNKNLD